MGEKDYLESFTDRDRLRVRFITEKGQVVGIELIQYEAEIEGQWRPLVRYDTAHGYLHRDVMSPDGTQEKTKITYTALEEALTQVLEEIHRQWTFYRRMYEEKLR